MAPMRDTVDGGRCGWQTPGFALRQTGGKAGAEGGNEGVACGGGIGHMLHLYTMGVVNAFLPATTEPFSPMVMMRFSTPRA